MKNIINFIALLILVLFLMNADVFPQNNEPDRKKVKSALLVIDIQSESLKYMSVDDKKRGIEVVNGTIYLLRQQRLPIQKTELDKILKEKGCNTQSR